MNKILMKLKCILIISAFILTMTMQAFAAAPATPATKTISLQNAIDTAIKSNTSIMQYEEKIKVADRRYQVALSKAKDAVNKSWKTEAEHITKSEEETLYPLQKEDALNDLKWEKEDTIKKAKLDITRLYYQALLTQQQADVQASDVERAKNEYDVKKKEVELGNATQSTLLSLEIAVDEAKTRLTTIQRDKDKLIMDLNVELGFDVSQKLVLKNETFSEEEFVVPDLNKLVNDLTKIYHSVKDLEKDKELAQKEREIIVSWTQRETPAEADALEDKILNLDYSIRDKKVEVEYKIRSDYNNVLNLKDDITLKKMAYDKAVKLESIAKVRYDIGMTSALEYTKSQGDVDDALTAYKKAKLDYYIAVEDYKNYINQ